MKEIEVFKTEFSKCLAPQIKYTDPTYEVDGIDAIAALADESAHQFPGRVFRRVTDPENHHQVARYTWDVVLPTGTLEGQDIIEFDNDGLITRIISFFKF